MINTLIVDNVNPRRDAASNILDAHDGCLQFFEGRFYLYGTQYGNHDERKETHKLVAYSSSDLQDWRNHGSILDLPGGRNYWRPHVIYNEGTEKYVLWHHSSEADGFGGLGVATADHPQGPFEVITTAAQMQNEEIGDLGLFVDKDGLAYIIYAYGRWNGEDDFSSTPIPPHNQIAIEKLTHDYLRSSGSVTRPIAGNCEAPALFRRGDLYYVLSDNTCAWCEAGSGARVYIAENPMGPFIYMGNINRVGPETRGLPSPWTPPGSGREDAIINAQQTFVAVLPGCEGDTYLWMADRWGSTPDRVMGHDFQYWGVLSFEQDGMIKKLEGKASWTIEVLEDYSNPSS